MNKIDSLRHRWYFPIILVGIYLCFIHIFIYFANYHDDVAFAKAYHGLSLFEAFNKATSKLESWSSRYIIEYQITIFYTILNRLWFVILDIFVLILFLYSLIKLVCDKVDNKDDVYIISGFFLLFPMSIISAVGWLGPSINFVWPISFALYSSLLLKNILLNENSTKIQYFIGVLSFIYAVNAEQVSAVYTIVITLLLVYNIYNKKYNKLMFFMFTFSIINLLFHLIWKGNASRKVMETINWFPNFEMITYIEKIELGFMQIAANIFYAPNLMNLILCVLIFLIIWQRYKDFWILFLSSFPLAVIMLFGFFNNFFSSIYHNFNMIPTLKGFLDSGKYDGVVSFDNFFKLTSYFPVILAVVSVLFLAVAIYYSLAHKSKPLSLFMSFIYLLGIGGSSIMGFSPTIYASAYRTQTIVYLCIMIVLGFIYYNNRGFLDNKYKRLFKIILLIAVILSIIIQSEHIIDRFSDYIYL